MCTGVNCCSCQKSVRLHECNPAALPVAETSFLVQCSGCKDLWYKVHSCTIKIRALIEIKRLSRSSSVSVCECPLAKPCRMAHWLKRNSSSSHSRSASCVHAGAAVLLLAPAVQAPAAPQMHQHARQQDANRLLAATGTAAPSSKQTLVEQHQQSAQAEDVMHLPDVQPNSRAAKQQRKQQQGQSKAVAAAASQSHISAFEADRAARIAANMARLAALELPQLAAGLAAMQPAGKAAKGASSAGPSQRGLGSSKRKRGDEQQVVRRSARNKGEAPDPATAGGISYEARDGSVVLLHGAAGHWGGDGGEPAAAVPPRPLPFRSVNGDEGSDAAFLALLAAQAAAVCEQQRQPCNSSRGSTADDVACGEASRQQGSGGAATGQQLSALRLAADDVAKVTRDGISCLAFHPSSSRLVIAAADKQGKVGLWDIDHPPNTADGESSSRSSSYDGVLMFAPHRDYVSSLRWANSHTLVSGSYDGTVRTLDVNTGVWDLLPGVQEDDNNWSAGDVSADGAVLYLATSDGGLSVVDSRSNSSSSSSMIIATRKVNTLHLHANQRHLASSASDGSVAVWDVRSLAAATSSSSKAAKQQQGKAAKPLCSVGHSKSSQGACWCPDGSGRLLSISFDDTLRVWQDPAGPAGSSGKLQQALAVPHNNNTGRWVVPFRPAWSPAGDALLVGDMKRGVALFDAASGAQACLLAAEPLTAIPSRLALHPAGLPVLAAATSSGRVHIWR